MLSAATPIGSAVPFAALGAKSFAASLQGPPCDAGVVLLPKTLFSAPAPASVLTSVALNVPLFVAPFIEPENEVIVDSAALANVWLFEGEFGTVIVAFAVTTLDAAS